MIDVLILAVALSMDAFAVAIGLGARHRHRRWFLAGLAAAYFGASQGLMPLLGYLGGVGLLGWIGQYSHWIAFGLLMIIGVKMLVEAFGDDDVDIPSVTHRAMLMLAIATSIDALAAGFTLNLLDVSAWLACGIIAVTTAGFSYAGVFIGARSGVWLESRAELLGGVVLVGMAFRMLLF